MIDQETQDRFDEHKRINGIEWLNTGGFPPVPFRFKSDYHRRAWWWLNNASSRPDPDPEATGWWIWSGSVILYIIDRLNALLGAGKPKTKRKQSGEQMATLADLFYGVQTKQRHKWDFTSPDWNEAIDNSIQWRMNGQLIRHFRDQIDAMGMPFLSVQDHCVSYLFGIPITLDNNLANGIAIGIGAAGRQYKVTLFEDIEETQATCEQHLAEHKQAQEVEAK